MRNQYFDDPGLSRGYLLNFKRSSKSGAYLIKQKRKDTEAMNFGRAFHSYMEFDKEEDFFNTCIVFNPANRPEPNKNFNSNKNKEWKKSIFNSSKDVITVEQYKTIKRMKQSAQGTQFYKRAFTERGDIKFEREFYTEIDGDRFKCLTDVSIEYPDRLICIDWKTTSSTLDVENEYSIKRELKKWDLQLQETHYRKVIQANTDKEVIFVFFFVETSGANECLPVVISEGSDIMQEGEYLWNKCLYNYKQFKAGKIEGIDKYLTEGLIII